MKIIHKLFAVAGVSLLGLGILTAVMYSTLNNVSHEVHTLAENDLPASSLLLNIDRDAYQAQLGLERYVAEDSGEHAEEALEGFQGNAAQTEERFLLYEEVAVGVDGEAAYAEQFWAARTAWIAAADELVALRQSGLTLEDIALQEATDNVGVLFEEMRGNVDVLQESIYDARASEFGPKVAADLDGATRMLLILGAVAFVASIAAAYWIGRRVQKPLEVVTAAAAALAVGDTSQEITHTSKDETGAIAAAFREITVYLREASAAASSVAEGDLTTSVEPRSEADALGMSLATMIANLRDVVSSAAGVTRQVDDGSEVLAASSEESARAASEVATSINSVADGATDQAVIAEGLASAVARIKAELEATNEAFSEVTSASADAEQKATDGGEKVEQAIVAMDRITNVFAEAADTVTELGNHSERVEEIVDLIRSIAEQTNLLALNAAIEAARAGEMGRGFAVVASEVKSLAEESSQSTEQIAEIVAKMRESVAGAITAMTTGRSEVDSGASIVTTAGDSFASINGAVQVISSKVEDAARSTSAIQQASEAIGASSSQLIEITEAASAASAQVAASSEEAAATSEEIGATAQELSSSAKQLRSAMDRFNL